MLTLYKTLDAKWRSKSCGLPPARLWLFTERSGSLPDGASPSAAHPMLIEPRGIGGNLHFERHAK